jgi:uncharacterized protein
MPGETSAIDDLFQQLSQLERDQQFPPVAQWHPEREGVIDIRIDKNGEWFHEGDRFQRQALVKLFATILRKDPDGYFLVTPAEKLRIEVEDVPFVAVDVESGNGDLGPELIFTTNVDEYVTADDNHAIWVDSSGGSPRPYVHVRSGLNALISRPLYYRLIDLCVEDENGHWLHSRGQRFSLD